jgi:hypothetical protein
LGSEWGLPMTLQTGQSIAAPFLPSKAEVKKFELRAAYASLDVVLQDDSLAPNLQERLKC